MLLPRLADANRYRGLIEERASRAIGLPVRLGEVRLALLPGVGLRVDRLTVAGSPEGADLLVADGLRVGARLLPLLRRRLEITSVELVRPALRLHRAAGPAGARVRLEGEAGPLGLPGEPFPLRGELTASRLGAELVARLGRVAGLDLSALARSVEAASGRVEIDALIPRRAALRGSVSAT